MKHRILAYCVSNWRRSSFLWSLFLGCSIRFIQVSTRRVQERMRMLTQLTVIPVSGITSCNEAPQSRDIVWGYVLLVIGETGMCKKLPENGLAR
jgi:hypothetical protein